MEGEKQKRGMEAAGKEKWGGVRELSDLARMYSQA
jgi:hypothetical protein